MARPSIAEAFFRGLIAKGSGLFAHLDGLRSATVPTTESEWLDCKGAARITDADVQKYWSKTLAAFGTTQGGVLIWGLDCRKQGDPPVDCVTGPSYVATPTALKSRLMELHHLATDPPIQGVEVEAVPDPADASRGFVVCFVPENGVKPVRAEHAGKQFYIRVGDDSVVPSTALLRALFAPGSQADLAVQVRVKHWPEASDERSATHIQYWVDVTNRGLVSVNGVYVALIGTDRHYAGSFSTPDNWKQRSTSSWPTAFEAPRAIHPGETTTAFKFEPGILLKQKDATAHILPNGYQQVFDLRIFAEHQAGFRARVTIVENDVYHRVARDCEILPLA